MSEKLSDDITNILQAIKKHGYVKIPKVFSEITMADTLSEVKRLQTEYAEKSIGSLPKLDQGQEVIYNLQNKSALLTKLLLSHSLIKNILCATLNDQWHQAIPLDQGNYILRSFLARNNQVATPMHIDSYIPYQGDFPLSMQVSIILEAQTAENGCTLLVPGSHQSGEYVQQSDREKSIDIESAVGDVVIWDSRIWHGTNENSTEQSRWSLIGTFVRWWIKQGYQITEQLPNAIYQTLNDEEKAIMGYCSRPFKDEKEGIDFKTGFDALPKRTTSN